MPTGTDVPARFDFALSARLMADSLIRAGGDALSAAGPPLELDLAPVPFLTAACLGRLVALRSRLLAMGGRLVLRNVGGAAWEAIRATRLDALLDVRRG